MTTLYTAKKYAVPALESQCVEFLKCNLNPENAFMLLSQARLFDEQQLADLCLETIDKNTTEAISAEGFVDIDLHTLSSVLKRDTLSIRECKLFQAIVRWADAECQRQQIASTAQNKRRVLGKLTTTPLHVLLLFKYTRRGEVLSIFMVIAFLIQSTRYTKKKCSNGHKIMPRIFFDRILINEGQ